MKKLTLITITLLAANMLFTSCKKTYQCTCNGAPDDETYIEIKSATRAKAKKECYNSGKHTGDPLYYPGPGLVDCHLVD